MTLRGHHLKRLQNLIIHCSFSKENGNSFCSSFISKETQMTSFSGIEVIGKASIFKKNKRQKKTIKEASYKRPQPWLIH